MDAAVVESAFEQSFPATIRLAAVRAATVATLYGLPAESRRDLEQEALLELWRKRTAYAPARGSWRTFAERVVANRMVSLMRSMHSDKSGSSKQTSIESARGLSAPMDRGDLRVDVWVVLGRISPFDRTVAVCLIDYSAIETSQKLGVARATVYRSIKRMRAAFAAEGFGSGGRHQEKGR